MPEWLGGSRLVWQFHVDWLVADWIASSKLDRRQWSGLLVTDLEI